MKIIALTGPVDSGKSHTINIVYFLLLKDGYKQEPGHFRELGNLKHEDIIDILSKDKLRIGIIGMGDIQRGPGRLTNLIKELENKDCNIVICACRNIPEIERDVKQYPDHVLVPKTISSDPANNRIINLIDAESLISYI